MVEKQLEVLRTFPIHPKRSVYEKELVEEQEKLKKVQTEFSSKVTEFKYTPLSFLFPLFPFPFSLVEHLSSPLASLVSLHSFFFCVPSS
jgi:hypothetical protein